MRGLELSADIARYLKELGTKWMSVLRQAQQPYFDPFDKLRDRVSEAWKAEIVKINAYIYSINYPKKKTS